MKIILRNIDNLLERKKTLKIRFNEYTFHEPTVKEWIYLNSLDFEKMENLGILKEYLITLSNFKDIELLDKLSSFEINEIITTCFSMMKRNEDSKIEAKESDNSNNDKIFISMEYRIAKFCKYTSTSLSETLNTNIFIFNSILDGIQALEAEETLRMSEIIDNHLHLNAKNNKDKYRETLQKYSNDFKEKGIKVVRGFSIDRSNELKQLLKGGFK